MAINFWNIFLVLYIPLHALTHLPLIDFRAYKIDNSITEGRTLPENAKKDIYKDVWFYEVNGLTKEFTTEDKPWLIKGAVFKDRKTNLIEKGDEPLIKDFEITDYFTSFDMTDSILGLDKVVLLVSHDIEKTKVKAHSLIDRNVLDFLNSQNIPIYGLSASSLEDVETTLLLNKIDYPYFSVDQTTLKTIIRSNPGLIVLEKGVVKEKLHWRDFPKDWKEFINK